ncbi:major facilitator superfamily domain-containing protein [Xylariales sp. PMI_506]|nr:major facilitator superfamily domain-containing protein [Xylariales sp. PMI_506]
MQTIEEKPSPSTASCLAAEDHKSINDSPLQSPETAESEGKWIHGFTLVKVIAGVTLVVFLMLLDTSIVSTAIPQITNQFHSLEDIGWYGSAYTMAGASLQTFTGKLYVYVKSKWLFLAFFGIFEIGSLICGLATSSKALIIGRAVAGMGSSGMLNGGLNIVAGAVPMHRRSVSQLGIVGGPLLGGVFTTTTTWRWCFYINLPIGGLVAILLLFSPIPEQQPKGRTREVWRTLSLVHDLDLVGFVLFAAATIQLLLALEYGSNSAYAWGSATVVGLICGAAATFGALLVWERHMGKQAMMPGHIIGQRVIWCSYLMGAMIYGVTMTSSYYLPVYFQAVRGKSALVSGVDLLPNILCQMVMAVMSGILITKLGYYLPWGVGGAVLTAISCGMLSTLDPSTPVPAWAGYLALLGFGRGAAVQVPMIAVQNASSQQDISVANAMMMFSQTFGAAVFLTVAGTLFTEGLRHNLAHYAPMVDAEAVVAAGITGFREIVTESELPAVLVAYAKSVAWVFYLNLGLCVIMFIASLGTGWRSVKKSNDKSGSI